LDADPRKKRESDLRPDTGDLDQAAKQPALLVRAEGVKNVRILAHDQMREQAYLLAHLRQVKKRGHRSFQLISDSSDLHCELRRWLGRKTAAYGSNHRAVSSSSHGLYAGELTLHELAEPARVSVTDRDRQGIGGIHGDPAIEAQQRPDHVGDLEFLGRSGADE